MCVSLYVCVVSVCVCVCVRVCAYMCVCSLCVCVCVCVHSLNIHTLTDNDTPNYTTIHTYIQYTCTAMATARSLLQVSHDPIAEQ